MTVGLLGIFGVIVFLMCGVPIGITLAIIGFVGFTVLAGFQPALGMLASLPYHISTEWTFVVIPMFMLLGNFASTAGLGKDAYLAAFKWIGHIRGGLMAATTLANCAFGFASGSSLAAASTFATIALPEAEKFGYNRGFTLAAVASAGTLSALIPPSGMMVFYCIFTEVSLGKVLIAGIFPGLLTGILFLFTIYLRTRQRPDLAPVSDVGRIPLKEKLESLKMVGPIALVMLFVLGGIYLGIFTPTEAGAIAAIVAFILLLIRKRKEAQTIFAEILKASLNAVGTTAIVFIIIVGAFVFGRFLAASGIISAFSDWATSLPVPPIIILILMIIVLLVMGTFMEVVAIVGLTMPVFFPVIVKLGFDPVWFGIIVVMMVEIGVLTPPLGTNVYVVKASADSIGYPVTLENIFAALWPFFLSYIVAVALIVAFPSIALYLVNLMWQ